MNSIKFLQCWVPLMLAVMCQLPSVACVQMDSATHSKLQKQIDGLERRIEQFEKEIDLLRDLKDNCYRDLEKIQIDLDHSC